MEKYNLPILRLYFALLLRLPADAGRQVTKILITQRGNSVASRPQAVRKLTFPHALNKNKLKPHLWVPYLFPTPLIGNVTLYNSTRIVAFFLSLVLLFISIIQLPATERNSFKEATNGILSNSVGQVFTMPTEGKAISHTIINCKEENQFNSWGSPLYLDEKPNTDTITFCPQNPWQVIKISFTHFDVANGDALEVYEGDL